MLAIQSNNLGILCRAFIFSENLLGSCKLPLEVHVVRFSVWKRVADNSVPFAEIPSFQEGIQKSCLYDYQITHTLPSLKSQMVHPQVHSISFSWFANFGKTLIIDHRPFKLVYSDKVAKLQYVFFGQWKEVLARGSGYQMVLISLQGYYPVVYAQSAKCLHCTPRGLSLSLNGGT